MEDLDKSNREKREFAKVKKRSENVSITPNTTISYESKNQFEVLSVSDHKEEVNKSASDLDQSEARHNNTDISAKHGDKPRQSGDKPNQRRSGQNSRKIERRQQSKGNIQDCQLNLDERKTKTKQRQPNIVILGDSMLKHLNPRRIQQGIDQKISIKTFPGAGVDEMTHYVKPTLQKKPKHIILHIGTNDLQTKSPDALIKAVTKLGEAITQEISGIELTLSEVITRTDDLQLADKVNIYNNKLDNLCTERNWGFITHKSITKTHLNSYGLHLNQRGTTALARNIKQFLKNQSLN
ncbi:Scavenger receptor cysteine-rich type 1 M130 [Paramuricea clavata]|uniref:Scavenger receptor cysteine-rich type 1 M130 n=1 Tax=Paramuricea clavata TaxID=317549 RepID=A0A7D9DKG1_PARCT|nr:Scavenger receptor cysteine-rich type 1 M130 [Paramuricea clavata]